MTLVLHISYTGTFMDVLLEKSIELQSWLIDIFLNNF